MRSENPMEMKRRNLFGLMACAPLASVLAPPAAATLTPSALDAAGQMKSLPRGAGPGGFAWQRVAEGLQFRAGGLTKSLLFYGPGLVRVTAHLGESYATQPSLVVVTCPQPTAVDVSDTPNALTVTGAGLRITVDKRSGALAFFTAADDRLLMREREQAPTELQRVDISGSPTYSLSQTFELTPDESLYGLGQYNEPYMDYRGRQVLMVQTNIGIVVPFLVSTRRWGLLWDVYSKMSFSDGPQGATFRAESAPAGADYYVVAGADMDGVMAGYRALTGAAPMFPKAAFGLFMSKERYHTQQQLLDVVRRFRADHYPLDYIVQDWQYWGGEKNGAWDGKWSGMVWDAERFPAPAAMTRELHGKLHVKLMASIWPSVGNDTALARELDAKGLRFEPLHWISKKARIYDAFSPEGRRIYFKHVKKGLLDVGVDALWMDGTEVEVGGAAHDPGEVEADIKRLGRNAMGDFTRYLNVYSLVTTRGVYEGQRAAGQSGKRVLTLTRSAWAGQQRYAALPWSGDTTASWAALRQQIAGGLNVGMAGLPYWSQDTGGFFVNYAGGERNPAWRELYARWNQFGIFNPVYRIHGTSVEREPYLFKTLDPQTYGSLLGATRLRYQLLHYIYSLAWRSTQEGYIMMRGLAMDFPDQAALRKVDDTYMFGPAFLVQPITRPMFNVELPPPATVPATQLRTPEGQSGLVLEYFEGMNFEKPASQTVDTVIDHRWPDPPLGSVPPGLSSLKGFSARWTGTLTAFEGGEYEIGAEGDDGFRIWLDDQLVVDDWAVGGARFSGHRLTLREGQTVKLRIDFFQDGGGRVLRLAWRTPNQMRDLAAARPKLDQRQPTLLPAGSDWFDFWTGQRHAGGRQVERDYALDQFPLFVRTGSILPLGPVVEHTGQSPDAPWEIRVYPGADGSFTLYEDDGETYRYERGERATTVLRWDDARRTLHIGTREGRYPGMTTRRELRVRIVAPPGQAEPVRTVPYEGRALAVSFNEA